MGSADQGHFPAGPDSNDCGAPRHQHLYLLENAHEASPCPGIHCQ